MLTTTDIYELIEARRLELGLSQMQLGQAAFGRDDNSAIQNLKRGSSPTFDRLNDICRALGLEVKVERPSARHGMGETSRTLALIQPGNGRAGYLPIPWNRPAPGKGSAPLSMSVEWLENHAMLPDDLSAVIPDLSLVDGIIPQNTVAILQAKARRRGNGQIWCLSDGGNVLLARIAWLKDGFVIMPPTLDQAPRVVMSTDVGSPSPIGRVACLAVIIKE